MKDYKTATGTLKASTLKAMRWYIIEHTLRFKLSTPPTYFFEDQSGAEVRVHVDTIIEEYEQFKKSTHGRKVRA